MNLSVPDFLQKARANDASAEVNLAELTKLVRQLISAREEIERIEGELASAKEVERDLSQVQIPQLVNAAGLSQITLSTGEKVKVKEDVSVSVPPEKQNAFMEWLMRRGEDDIVKVNVAFDKMEPEKLADLMALLSDYSCEVKKGVHPQTLAKYFRELLGVNMAEEDRETGIAAGVLKRKEEVEPIANVFLLHKTYVD
jgi:hypothetical protein